MNKTVKIILGGVGGTVLFGVVLFVGIEMSLMTSAPYKNSVAYIKADPQIKQYIGDNIRFGIVPLRGNLSVNAAADFSIRVKGPKGSGIVYTEWEMRQNKWRMKGAILILSGGKEIMLFYAP